MNVRHRHDGHIIREEEEEKYFDENSNEDYDKNYSSDEESPDDVFLEDTTNDERMLSSPSIDFFDDEDDYDYENEDGVKDVSGIDFVVPNKNDKANIDDLYDEEEFMNEEGSGGYDSKYKDILYKNSFRLDFLDKYRHQKTKKVPPPPPAPPSRVSEDDEYEDDDEVRRRIIHPIRHFHEGSGGSYNDVHNDDEDDEDDDDSFFPLKRKPTNKYFRKNTNDAIKIISTPHGKVGIVYQQTDLKPPTSISNKIKDNADPMSQNSPPTQHQRITPVLTADGKVALLYRGASENTKYEPLLNLTHNFNYDNKTSASKTNENDNSDSNSNDVNYGIVTIDSTTNDNRNGNDYTITSTISPQVQEPRTSEYENSILPMINRPLSEVLGIKKNQFKQFRIKDSQLSTTIDPYRYPPSTPHTIAIDRITEKPIFDSDDFDNRVDNDHNQNTNLIDMSSIDTTVSTSDIISKTEVVNLAIIPHFDENFDNRLKHHHENHRHHRQRHRHRLTSEQLSGLHCVMQAMMGVAAVSTVFGMLGAFFKQRIIDQIRMMHW